jgi:hypothetical protein
MWELQGLVMVGALAMVEAERSQGGERVAPLLL